MVLPERAKIQYSYTAKFKYSNDIDYQKLFDQLNDYPNDRGGFYNDSILYFPDLTDESAKILKNTSGVIKVEKIIESQSVSNVLTYDFKYNPNVKDDFLNIIARIKESNRFVIEEKINNVMPANNLIVSSEVATFYGNHEIPKRAWF